jgi:Replication-relaxation
MDSAIPLTSGHRPDRIDAGDAGTDPSDPDGIAPPAAAPVGASASPSERLAAPVGTAPGGRRSGRDTDVRLLAVIGRLTDRDRQLCRLLDEHRVLTTAQIADVGFTGERRARQRLAELYALEVLDRFRPATWATPAPYHWTLGPLGAALVAAETGAAPADLSWRRTLARDLAQSQRLAHLVGTNGFFTALLRSTRTRPGCSLDAWWSERRCAREWGAVVRPDGYGIWTEAGTSLPFLLEHDNGTEPLARLAAKLDGYRRLAQAAGHANWVLFSFPTPRREHDAGRALAGHGVPVATASRTGDLAPDRAAWTPLTPDVDRRLGLAALAHLPLGTAE